MDVLVYSALNEQAALKKEIHEKQQCLFDFKQNKEASGGSASEPLDVNAEICAKAWFCPTSDNFEKKQWACPGCTDLWKPYEGFGWTDNFLSSFKFGVIILECINKCS